MWLLANLKLHSLALQGAALALGTFWIVDKSWKIIGNFLLIDTRVFLKNTEYLISLVCFLCLLMLHKTTL